ncbi:hypothetical protein AB0H42_32510 [Nocardia sp. NPDC050799]|uniref:hypothetical protein n=1 Tax=Nocardia sp. NPDC050799 TaxID=3154842 RepID=UPI003402BAFB
MGAGLHHVAGIERLRTVFSDTDDPAVRHVLGSLEQTPDSLFDSVRQVKMPRWSRLGP